MCSISKSDSISNIDACLQPSFSPITPDMQEFILANANATTDSIILKYRDKKLPFDLDFALAQIKGRQRCKIKLPSFLKFNQFLFPDMIASEQASDELVAHFHAMLAGSGLNILDMTAGLGIDAISMAMNGCNVTALDLEPHRTEILSHNARLFTQSNENHDTGPSKSGTLTAINGDSISFLQDSDKKYDLIFIDPARRGDLNSRVYSFNHCLPNVVENMNLMLDHSDRILIKGSPLVDIEATAAELPATNIYIVSAHGECKEMLIEIIKDSSFKGVHFIDLKSDGSFSQLSFNETEMNHKWAAYATVEDITPGRYIYEPNAGLMKFTGYGALCSRYGNLKKISQNTSLYISDTFIPDFQGRVCMIESLPSAKEIKTLKGKRYNVSVRNYTMPAEQLRKKLGVKEGTDGFIYGFKATDKQKPMLAICSKIKA